MSTFRITETVVFEVEGDTPQDAMDAWLNDGEQAEGYAFCGVNDRSMHDAEGNDVDWSEDQHYDNEPSPDPNWMNP